MMHRINVTDRSELYSKGESWYEQILANLKAAQLQGKEEFEYAIDGQILSLTKAERNVLATVSMGICRLLERDGYFPVSYRQGGIQWFMVFFSKEGRDDFWQRQRDTTWRSPVVHSDEVLHIWKKASPDEWRSAVMGEFLFDKPQNEHNHEKATQEKAGKAPACSGRDIDGIF